MLTNIHVHTPFSYSIFQSIDELVTTAKSEGISVLGINDLNTTDGYNEFSAACKEQNLFPVFNIEFSLEDFSDMVVKYCSTGKISGKALPFPMPFPGDVHNLIASIWKGSQDRIWKMIDKLNELLAERDIPLTLDYRTIRSLYSKDSVHEQHVAKALHKAILAIEPFKKGTSTLMEKLFTNSIAEKVHSGMADIEHLIVTELLGRNKPAFIPMPSDTILTIAHARQLIIRTGGLPCFQCTLSENNDADDPAELEKYLVKRGIAAIEFIPHKTTVPMLTKFMHHFNKKQFCVSIGTGSYASQVKSTLPVLRDGARLPDDLVSIGYEGACILAAHHEDRLRKQPGFIDELGKMIISPAKLPDFIALGHQIIQKTLHPET